MIYRLSLFLYDIDLITAGIPCLGFSPLGLQKGFEHVQTKLFYELLRLVDECQPSILFLENVPNVVNHGMHVVVDELHDRRGYELLWVVLPAYAVGAYHTRLRWFCLAKRTGFQFAWSGLSFKRHDFQPAEPPPRMVKAGDPFYNQRGKRCFLLGNSIVPCVARLALFLLASGFRQSDITSSDLIMGDVSRGLRMLVDETEPGFMFPRWGGVVGDNVFRLPTIYFQRPTLSLKLVQKHPLKYVLTERVTSPVLECRQLRLWSTPRAGNVGTSRILTDRSSRDLPTQVKFEEGTPDDIRDGQINPDWIENVLMGYPIGFTCYK